jgi:hypothetical protein
MTKEEYENIVALNRAFFWIMASAIGLVYFIKLYIGLNAIL